MPEQKYKHTAVGGSDIQVILEFPSITINGSPGMLHLTSAISVSYSVYRAKTNVYNIGQPLLAGLALGKKYVAGSIITVSWDIDEISEFVNEYIESKENIEKTDDFGRVTEQFADQELNVKGRSLQSYKQLHTVMRDDLTSFNMMFVMDDEYYGAERVRCIKVYDCQFINNGQVMSINDIVTENTLSFIARDIREQHAFNKGIVSLDTRGPVPITASALLSS